MSNSNALLSQFGGTTFTVAATSYADSRRFSADKQFGQPKHDGIDPCPLSPRQTAGPIVVPSCAKGERAKIYRLAVLDPTTAVPGHLNSDELFASTCFPPLSRAKKQIHRLHHEINELVQHVSEHDQNDPAIRELISYGCTTRIHEWTIRASM
ncbi:DUF3734 domain-containing protein [Sedimenticola hydrogenitrophicus]|uniref:DUF3734 domain-containing protein n=1 Tax=Sedimenticola hydrogenitrophicus TaxID=2967975 RepID=UPI003B5866F2